jgi:hypothetical protein
MAESSATSSHEINKEGEENMTMLMPGDILSSIIILANPFLNDFFSSREIGMMILVWIILSLGGVVICHLIGSVVWRLIASSALGLSSEQ